MKRNFSRLKRLIACISAASVLLSAVAVLDSAVFGLFAAAADVSVWSGEVDAELAGAGTQEDPYQIATAEQFAAVVSHAQGEATANSLDKYYILTEDIRLNNTDDADWMNRTGANQPRTWYGSNSVWFRGTIDGQGHTVSGLYFDGQLTDGSSYGLFSLVNGATIKNIGLIDSYVKVEGKVGGGATYVGGLIGQVNTAAVTVSGCYVDESVFLSNQADSTSYIGGVIGGGAPAVTVDGCYVLGMLEYYDTVKNYGAITGYHWGNKTITNCYAVGVKLVGDPQKIVESSQINYCSEGETTSYVTVIDSSLMLGEAARENMPLLDWTSTYYTTDRYPKIMYFSGIEPGDVWSGSVATGYAGGEGTAEDPYRIETAEQLAYLISADTKTAGKYYALTADIRLNDTTGNWTENNPHSWYESSVFGFYGTFCGQGHTVSGLYYNDVLTANRAVGLFPRVFNAVIQDVGLTDSYLCSQQTGVSYVGGIVGINLTDPVTVTGCYVDSSVTLRNAESPNGRIGGIIGGGGPAMTVDRCYFLGTIEHHADAPATRYGAIFGDCWNGAKNLYDCYAVGVKLNGSGSTSAGSGNNYSTETGDPANAHVTVIESAKMLGEAARTNMPLLDWTYTYCTTESYPELQVFNGGGTEKPDPDPDEGGVWSGRVATGYAGGDGTKDNPYLIATAEQLAYLISADTKTAGNYYKLTADILLNDTDGDWLDNDPTTWYDSSISNWFCGTIDGDGHTVSGIYYNETPTSGRSFALFPRINGASIFNIGITDSYIHVTATGTLEVYAAALVGMLYNSSDLKVVGCYADETVTIINKETSSSFVGGLLGGGTGSIEVDSCYFIGTLEHYDSATARYGAIFGNFWNSSRKVTDCYAIDTVYSNSGGANVSGENNYGSAEGETVTGVTVIDKSLMLGPDAKTNMPLLDWEDGYYVTERYPALKVIPLAGRPSSIVPEYDGVPGEVWSGLTATNYAGGSGTEGDPYLIATAEQLAKLVSNLGKANGLYYQLTEDIYLNDVSSNQWESTANSWYYQNSPYDGLFRGHFNGDGHVVYGLYINASSDKNVFAGLFTALGQGGSIEKVGISHSTMYLGLSGASASTEKYIGGIVGYISVSGSYDDVAAEDYPRISQCFCDSTVTIGSNYAGGIVGGAPFPPNVDNCYFVGTLDLNVAKSYGSIIGNTWTTHYGGSVRSCFGAADGDYPLCGGTSGTKNSKPYYTYEYNYANSNNVASAVTQLNLIKMRGNAALANMEGFDFDTVWLALSDGTPVLRAFRGGSSDFSNKTLPPPVQVSFVTNGGNEIDPVLGQPDTPLTLPVPVREGYRFTGWYVYRELDVLYSYDFFPNFDQILYAGWESLGFIQDFEAYPNSSYDVQSDYVYFRPGASGYNANYVKNGMGSMHRIGAEADERDFLIFYEDMLTPGQEYDMTFWITTDRSGTSADIQLVHEEWPDVEGTNYGDAKVISLTGLQDGDWKQISYRFVAQTRWIAIRTSGGASLYFDDFMVLPTSAPLQSVQPPAKRQNRIEELIPGTQTNTDQSGDDNATVVRRKKVVRKAGADAGWPIGYYILIGAGALLAVAAITVVILVLLRRRKLKQQPSGE